MHKKAPRPIPYNTHIQICNAEVYSRSHLSGSINRRPLMEPEDYAVDIKGLNWHEEGEKVVEKTKPHARNLDSIEYVQRKLVQKGIKHMERHPVDGLGLSQRPPKSGHGGRFTWEGPDDEVSSELNPAPVAIDCCDPNYVNEEEEKAAVAEVEGVVIGEVEVAKLADERKGVSRVEIRDPGLAD